MKLKADRHNFILWILTEDPLMTNGQNHGLITINQVREILNWSVDGLSSVQNEAITPMLT